MIKKTLIVLTGIVILMEASFLAYPYLQRRPTESFNCVANLVEHYSDDIYHLSLNYMIRDNFALAHITGYSEMNPGKVFNRKVSFSLQRNGDIYYMSAEKTSGYRMTISVMTRSASISRGFSSPLRRKFICESSGRRTKTFFLWSILSRPISAIRYQVNSLLVRCREERIHSKPNVRFQRLTGPCRGLPSFSSACR